MSNTTPLDESLSEQLSRNSVPYIDPLARIDWDALSLDDYWLPEEAISVYGLPEYSALSDEERRTLSQYEFLNFIEAGLWLEAIFMRRIINATSKTPDNVPRHIYHLHELREEAGHSLMFLEMMHRCKLELPRTRFDRLYLANMLGAWAPFENAAFWVAVLIGEEVPDRLNRIIRKHEKDISPTAFEISKIHLIEEARHIAHAKEMIDVGLRDMPWWQRKVYQVILQRVFRQFVNAFYFPPARVYELAGLKPGKEWAKQAYHNPHRIKLVDDAVRPTLRVLAKHDIHITWR